MINLPRAVNKKLKNEKIELILKASREIFSKTGFSAATIRQIAGAAGVAIGTIYIYFKNKDDILHELLNRHNEEHNTLFDKMSSLKPEKAVRFFYEDRFKTLSKINDLISIFMFEASRDKKLRGIIHKKIFETINEQMKNFFKTAIDDKKIRDFKDIEVLSVLMLSVVSSIVNWKECIFSKQLKGITYERFADAVTDLAINGLALK
jgi:TetR/AcrR family fatty acid metabolism transcriptional regulator